ncbi:hypothetical protein M9Y10_015222 [Tritrichomonas musculus]|uniref:Exocyst complex component Sec6 n=1 Tax=Tritrichomonas musculus TaxID=1915356 RepID=A0ABR2L250_9EUKA
MYDEYEVKTELSGSQELEHARKDAGNEAFQYVNKLISQSSNLESLEQDKQQAFGKHQSKIAYLKSQVQGIVTNIESGIDELQETAAGLKELKDEIKSIEDETNKREQAFSDNNQPLHDLALAFERATIIEELLNSFDSADEAISSISKYFEGNPDAFSIKLYTTIEALVEFEENLQSKVSDQSLKTFIESHFSPIHTYNDILINNVHKCLNTAFSQTPDALIRANWIMCAHDEHDMIEAFLLNAMTNETNSALEKIDQNNVSEYLKTLSGMIDYLPEKLELLMPSLPSDINGMDLIAKFVNTEIYRMLVEYRDKMPMNASLADSMIKCTKDIVCSLYALLAIKPSDDFLDFQMNLQSSFEQILYGDYQKFLDNIINLDIDSVSTRRDGIYYTLGPKDLIDRLLDAYNFAKNSSSNIAQVILPTLVDKLADAFVEVGNSACKSYNMKYIIACCNNSVEAVKMINDFAKQNADTIIEDFKKQNSGQTELTTKEATSCFTKKLQKPWGDMKNRGLVTLSKIAISRVIANDEDFRYDFNDKLDTMSNNLQDMSQHLFQPLYKKFLSIFSRELVPHYIQSYFSKNFEKPRTQEEFATNVTHECNALSQLFQSLEPNLCESSIKVIESFRDFLIDPYDSLHLIFHIIAKEYHDFTPGLAMSLVKIRVDSKDNKSELPEVRKGFEAMYVNVDQTSNERFFDPEYEEKKGIFDK